MYCFMQYFVIQIRIQILLAIFKQMMNKICTPQQFDKKPAFLHLSQHHIIIKTSDRTMLMAEQKL